MYHPIFVENINKFIQLFPHSTARTHNNEIENENAKKKKTKPKTRRRRKEKITERERAFQRALSARRKERK